MWTPDYLVIPEDDPPDIFHRDTGEMFWFDADGFRHRINGPAYVQPGTGVIWQQNRHIYRRDGPALELECGTDYWYHNGSPVEYDRWLEVADISEEEKVMIRLEYG